MDDTQIIIAFVAPMRHWASIPFTDEDKKSPVSLIREYVERWPDFTYKKSFVFDRDETGGCQMGVRFGINEHAYQRLKLIGKLPPNKNSEGVYSNSLPYSFYEELSS